MTRLRFIKEDDEEKEKFGWESRTRGIGTLPEPKSLSTKLKFTADVGIGAKAVGSATFSKPEPKSLPLSQTGFEGRMRGIGEAPKEYSLEGITTELSEVTKKRNSLWWNEIQATNDKWKFLRQENWSPELQQAEMETQRLSEEASKLGVNTGDWIEYGVYTAFFTTMAVSILPIVKGLPANLLNKLTYKVEGKTVKGQALKDILKRVAYPETGKPNVFDKKVFAKYVEEGGVKSLTERITKGVTVTEVTPRFAFGNKLYAGLPADEIVNSIVKVGKITTDISRELSLAKPELVSQVIQNLSIASPVIASKLAPELVKLIPQEAEGFKKVEPEAEEPILKVGAKEPVIPKIKELETLMVKNEIFVEDIEKSLGRRIDPKKPVDIAIALNYVKKAIPEAKEEIPKVEVKEPWQMTKKEYIGDTIWIESAKNEHIQSIVKAIKEGKPVPTEVLADYPDLKAKVKPPTIQPTPTEEKVKVEEKAPEAVPKAIPKELEPLAEEAREGEYLYHGTSEGAFRNIREEGITGEKEKYFADTEQYAETYAKRKGSDRILRVKKTPDFVEDKNIPEGGDFKTLENIPPENIEIKIGDKWIPIQEYADIDKNIIPIKPTPALKAEVAPKPAAKPEPTKAEPKPELATPAQINKSYAIAKSKAMISDLGKVKPQYRKVAEVMTGKKHIEDMTPEQAEMFIDALNRLPEPKYKNGKLVAPSIPRTTKLTTEGFFQKKYNEPTPIWLLTDQTYYAEKLGIKPLVEPFERGKQEFDLEFRRSSNLADRVVNKLNKIAKTPMGDRIKSKVKNIPTKAESKMAELLNKHEATPSGLSDKEEDVFKYFRNLSKDIWRRENEVREKVDLPPIKYKTAYFRHTADAMAKEMLEGKYPFPQGIKYWSEKMVGKKIFNPMEFQRKLSDDLIDIWSKDLRAVTKAMLWNGLKEIHLAEPAKFLNEQLNAISKDLPEYKNLTPREQVAYKQTQVMPASTKKWLINYINQVIKGQETETDASLNRIVTKSGLKGIFDKVLSPFGRAIGRKPITNIFSLSGRMVISGVMGWVPRQMIRNAFQQVQNLALYGVKATIKSFLPAGIDKNLKELLSESLFLKSYTGFEELPADLMGKLEKVWLYPYGVVANNNAKQGMKAAYWNILELIKNPKYKKYGWADPQRTKDTPKGHLYPSEKEKLLKEMEFGSSCTQYQYIPMGMPGVFRFKALIPLTRLQSWGINYATKFNREAIRRGLKGRPSWSGEESPTLPWSRRVNWLKYVIIGGAILTAMGYKRSFMLGVAPTYLSPAGQLVLGFYNYATANEDWKRKKALKQIYYSWKAFIPGSLAWRDFIAVWNGEKDLEEILFYGKKKEEKKVQPQPKITMPKEGQLKFTETKLDIKSTKLKFTF